MHNWTVNFNINTISSMHVSTKCVSDQFNGKLAFRDGVNTLEGVAVLAFFAGEGSYNGISILYFSSCFSNCKFLSLCCSFLCKIKRNVLVECMQQQQKSVQCNILVETI